jgi:hypothetical protein
VTGAILLPVLALAGLGLALVVLGYTLWCLDFLRAGIARFGSLGRVLGLDILMGRTRGRS